VSSWHSGSNQLRAFKLSKKSIVLKPGVLLDLLLLAVLARLQAGGLLGKLFARLQELIQRICLLPPCAALAALSSMAN
jgi:hypothetical protein